MKRPILMATLMVGGSLVGCGGDSSGPGVGGGGTITAKATDPAGDTFGAGPVQWDVTALTIVRDTGGITVTLDLSANVVSPVTQDSNATFAFVDFDTDQDSTTGVSSIVDDNRPSAGSTGMGVDYFIDFADFNADSTVNVVNASFATTGSVRPTFSGKSITARIPRSMLGGDDALLNAAGIVGTFFEPTDIVPENGHLKVGGTGPVGPNRSGVSALRPVPRVKARRWNRN